jgi:hypothetical protein
VLFIPTSVSYVVVVDEVVSVPVVAVESVPVAVESVPVAVESVPVAEESVPVAVAVESVPLAEALSVPVPVPVALFDPVPVVLAVLVTPLSSLSSSVQAVRGLTSASARRKRENARMSMGSLRGAEDGENPCRLQAEMSPLRRAPKPKQEFFAFSPVKSRNSKMRILHK